MKVSPQVDILTRLIMNNWYITLLFIYLGTVCYVAASYFHLHIKDWTFWKAFWIAIPLVVIEYQFSLRANRVAMYIHGLSPVHIVLITLCFYFVNVWLLNVFIIKTPVVVWRELLAFILIISAFLVTTMMH